MSNVSLIDGHMDNADHCVSCGAIIPEGRMVCPMCENDRREIKMSLIEKLQTIKVRKQADKDTIAEVINLLIALTEYNERMKYALSLIGFEPILHTEDEE